MTADQALKFVIHFVGAICRSAMPIIARAPTAQTWALLNAPSSSPHGAGDIHQPLHCGFDGDEGGNLVNITYFGQQERLHAIWDTNMIDTMLDRVSGLRRRGLRAVQQQRGTTVYRARLSPLS